MAKFNLLIEHVDDEQLEDIGGVETRKAVEHVEQYAERDEAVALSFGTEHHVITMRKEGDREGWTVHVVWENNDREDARIHGVATETARRVLKQYGPDGEWFDLLDGKENTAEEQDGATPEQDEDPLTPLREELGEEWQLIEGGPGGTIALRPTADGTHQRFILEEDRIEAVEREDGDIVVKTPKVVLRLGPEPSKGTR